MMSIQNYEAQLVHWYHTASGWMQFAVAFGTGFLLGAWIF